MDIIFDILSLITGPGGIIVGEGDKVRHQWNYRKSYKWDYSYDGRYKPEGDE